MKVTDSFVLVSELRLLQALHYVCCHANVFLDVLVMVVFVTADCGQYDALQIVTSGVSLLSTSVIRFALFFLFYLFILCHPSMSRLIFRYYVFSVFIKEWFIKLSLHPHVPEKKYSLKILLK